MLGYDSINSVLQGASARERIRAFLTDYLLFTYPAYAEIPGLTSDKLKPLVSFFMERFENDVGDLLVAYRLAALFEDKDFLFEGKGETEIVEASKKALFDVFMSVLYEMLEELGKRFSTKKKKLVSDGFIGQLFNTDSTWGYIPTNMYNLWNIGSYISEVGKVVQGNDKIFPEFLTGEGDDLLFGEHYASNDLISFGDIRKFDSSIKPENKTERFDLETTADWNFLKTRPKFFLEIFFRNSKLVGFGREQFKYMSLSEAGKAMVRLKELKSVTSKQHLQNFPPLVPDEIGVRLVMNLSYVEALRAGSIYSLLNSTNEIESPKPTFGWNMHPELGKVSTILDSGIFQGSTLSGWRSVDTLRLHFREGTKGILSQILSGKLPEKKIDTEKMMMEKAGIRVGFVNEVPQGTIGKKFADGQKFPGFKLAKKDRIFTLTFPVVISEAVTPINPFEFELISQAPALQLAGQGTGATFFSILSKPVLALEKDQKTKDFINKTLPYDLLNAIYPIYYSSLVDRKVGKDNKSMRDIIREEDRFELNKYKKSIDAMLRNLSKFDEV